MKTEWIIVDGYNLIHQDPDLAAVMERDIGLARQRLTRMLEAAIPRLARRVTVVFDGRGSCGGPSALESTTVEVVFSSASSSADNLIERLVSDSRQPERMLIVTSDRIEANAVSGSGAECISCPNFLDLLGSRRAQGRSRSSAQGRRRRKLGSLGDCFPLLV